jgi:hypothetical protein
MPEEKKDNLELLAPPGSLALLERARAMICAMEKTANSDQLGELARLEKLMVEIAMDAYGAGMRHGMEDATEELRLLAGRVTS